MTSLGYDQLTPLEWLMPRVYIRQIFAFPSNNTRSIPEKLREGLVGVIKDVPYLLSGVVSSDSPRGAVSLTEPYQSLNDLFSWHDLSQSIDYPRMKKDNFPPAAFSVPGLVPPDTIPPYPTPAPVFRARVSLVNGGFLLCVAVHHNTTDITGFGALLKLWASHCRTGASASLGFNQTWLDRRLLFPSEAARRKSSIAIPQLLHIREPTESISRGGVVGDVVEFRPGVFFFPWRTLQQAKQAVNNEIATHNPGSWVSTSDILTALLWSAVVEAELLDSDSGSQGVSTIGFPVNIRSRPRVSLPKDYLGAAFMMTTATASQQDLVCQSRAENKSASAENLEASAVTALSRIALAIRRSVNSVDGTAVPEVLEYVNSQAGIQPIVLGPRHDGISIVSWADQGVYDLDWGAMIGRCEAVRLPKLMNRRYPIIQPRIPESSDDEGGFEVIVSYDGATFERFEKSGSVMRFATLRCTS